MIPSASASSRQKRPRAAVVDGVSVGPTGCAIMLSSLELHVGERLDELILHEEKEHDQWQRNHRHCGPEFLYVLAWDGRLELKQSNLDGPCLRVVEVEQRAKEVVPAKHKVQDRDRNQRR